MDEWKHEMNLKGTPRSGLVMATFGFFIGFAAVSLYGPVASNLNKIMHMPGILLGFLVAAPQLTGSLLRIPFGAWVDKGGGKKPMLVLLLLAIVGMVGLTGTLYFLYPKHLSINMYPLIFIFGLLSGAGVATFSVGIPQTSYWFPQSKQGFALGTYGGLGNTAPGLFGMILPIALVSFGLTRAYVGWLLLLVAGTLVYALLSKDSYYFQLKKQDVSEEEARRVAGQFGQELFPAGKATQAFKASAKTPATWALVVLYFTSFGGFLALTTWLPTYWTSFHHLGIRFAGLLMALGFSLPSSFVRIYGGRLSDRYGGERVSLLGFSLLFVGAAGLVLMRNIPFDVVAEGAIGVGMGISNAAVFKMVPEYIRKAPGGASGWVGGLGAFGGFVMPPILGMFVQVFGSRGYAEGFIIYVLLSIVAILVSLGLLRKSLRKLRHDPGGESHQNHPVSLEVTR